MTDTPPPPSSTGEPDTQAPRPGDADELPPSDDEATTPPPRVTTRPFARSSRDRVLGGLVAGLADRLGVDVVPARIVAVVLGLVTGGFVVLLYLLGWLLVARDDDPAPRMYEHVAVRDGGVLTWVAVVLLGIAVLDGLVDPIDTLGTFPLLPLVLIGVGVALWTRGGGASTTGRTAPGPRAAGLATATPPPPPGTTPVAGPTTTNPMQEGSPVPTDTTTPTAGAAGGWPPTEGPDRTAGPATRPPAPPARGERSVLGPLTIALALVAAGVAAALDASASVALDLGTTGVLSVGLLTIGVGLLVGSVWGRARWLFAIGLLLMPFVAFGLVVRAVDEDLGVDVDLASGVGERRVVLDGAEELPDDLDLIAGQIDVDLSEWDPGDAELAAIEGSGTDLAINVGAGEVVLDVPADVAWRVTSGIGLGEYRVRGDGVDISTSVEDFETFPRRAGDDPIGAEFVREGGPDEGPVLDVAVDVGLGQITINETAGGADATASTPDTEEQS